jgi:hypothetical protein
LLQAAELFKLERAPKQNLRDLEKWFKTNNFLDGIEALTYFTPEEDKVTKRKPDQKAFSARPDLISLYDYRGLEDPAPEWMGKLISCIFPCLEPRKQPVVFSLTLYLLLCVLTFASLIWKLPKLAHNSSKSIVDALITQGQS